MDEKEFSLLVSRYLKPVHSFLFRYVGSREEAEDLTQETFVRVWKNLKKYDRGKSFKTWTFAIAKNAAIDFLKKKKSIPLSRFSASGGSTFGGEDGESYNSILESMPDPEPLPEELFSRRELGDILSLAMEKIPAEYRMVLFLHYNDHFTFREIAESLEEPLNTVKSRHRRALFMLKDLLSGS